MISDEDYTRLSVGASKLADSFRAMAATFDQLQAGMEAMRPLLVEPEREYTRPWSWPWRATLLLSLATVLALIGSR